VGRERGAPSHHLGERRRRVHLLIGHPWLLIHGRAPRVAVTSCVSSSRRYRIATRSPGFLVSTSRRRASRLSTATPSTRRSTSPERSPTRAAALPGSVADRVRPSPALRGSTTTPRNAPPATPSGALGRRAGAALTYAGRAPPT